MTAATGRAVALVDALNAALGLGLADAAEARAWLSDGGWARLDAWIAARRATDAEDEQPET